MRLDKTQHRIGAECGVDRTAAGFEQLNGDRAREALTGGGDAVARRDGCARVQAGFHSRPMARPTKAGRGTRLCTA